MGREKQRRHTEDREDRPASTNAPGHEDFDEQSLRFGEGPVADNAKGRILSVSVVGGMTRVMIGLGKKQGIHVGMEGYIKDGDGGMFADFQIEEVKDRTSYALVDATVDAIQDTSLQVVVNPSSMPIPAPKKNMKARILAVSIQEGRTRITIGLGKRHGARWGMKGYVVGDGGNPLARFVVDEEHPGTCEAFIETTIDGLGGHHQVILNPG